MVFASWAEIFYGIDALLADEKTLVHDYAGLDGEADLSIPAVEGYFRLFVYKVPKWVFLSYGRLLQTQHKSSCITAMTIHPKRKLNKHVTALAVRVGVRPPPSRIFHSDRRPLSNVASETKQRKSGFVHRLAVSISALPCYLLPVTISQ